MMVWPYHFRSLKIFILGTSPLYWHMLCPELGCPVLRLQKVQGRDKKPQNLENLLFKEILRELGREKCPVDLSSAWRKGVGKTEPGSYLKEQDSKKFHLSIRKNTFTVRVDKNQDRLPREVAECSSLEMMQWTALSKQLWLFYEQEAQWDGLQRCVPTSSLLWLCISVALGSFLIVGISFLGAQISSSFCRARLIV